MESRKPLSQSELERIVDRMFDEPESDDERVLSSDSDLSVEHIDPDTQSDSLSEQSVSDEESENENSVDDSFYIGKDKTTKWRKVSYANRTKIKQINIVKEPSGLKQCAKDISTELDAFLKIIDLAMIDEIVTFTNMYIDGLRTRIDYARERDCKNTSRSEFMAYLGLLLLVGIKKGHHANVKEIWAKDGTGVEITRAVMSYKRFLFLTRCLRFDDRTTRMERRKIDKLAAIRSFYDAFVNNCQVSFSLGEYTTIDEMLHPFRGRCSWIQYIPSKPAKYGVKMYALCDAKTFYTSNIEIYCGKQPDGPFALSNSPIEIVKRLVTTIENSGRNLTTDNYYTSIPLADYLLDKKITLMGTLKKNKKEIPPEFLPHKNKAVQSSLFGFQKDRVITSYVPRKNKVVILLSTLHTAEEIHPTTNKPQIIMDYNSTKGGVDTVDKMCATYSVSRITRRWPCVIFYSLMNIAGVNAQVLYSFAKPSNVPKFRRIFLKNIALSLMKEHLAIRASIKNLPSDISAFLKVNYSQPADISNEGPPLPKRGTCRSCVMEKKRTSASAKCHNCNSFTCKRHSKIEIVCSQCQEGNASHSD